MKLVPAVQCFLKSSPHISQYCPILDCTVLYCSKQGILLVQFIIDGPKMGLHKVKVLRNILDFVNKKFCI